MTGCALGARLRRQSSPRLACRESEPESCTPPTTPKRCRASWFVAMATPRSAIRPLTKRSTRPGKFWSYFEAEFGRRSIDGRGGTVSITVHYGRDYDNAFWDGIQLVFGDGDGQIFERFTKPMDVMAHEFTHGVTQFTVGLAYQDQPGALNESISDVFASMAKQRALGQTAAEADWLIGEGLFTSAINAKALRSMKEPGTAYDDPQIGRDLQVGSMADYVYTDDDSGGVHINSGIPNRAFVLAALDIGGASWEKAGQVWYDTLVHGELSAQASFGSFAQCNAQLGAPPLPQRPVDR